MVVCLLQDIRQTFLQTYFRIFLLMLLYLVQMAEEPQDFFRNEED